MKKLLTGGILSLLLCVAQAGHAQSKTCISGNCLNGYGTLQYPNGDRYRGEFVAGKPHGQGILYLSNGSKHWGTYKDSRREGPGKLRYHDGSEYIGQFSADRRSGAGVMTFANGDRYDGQWRNDRQEGKGDYLFSNGNRYTGEFRAGRFHGAGTMDYADGRRYTGQWAHNRYDGLGLYIETDGRELTAEYRSGKVTRIIGVKDTGLAAKEDALARDCNNSYCEDGLGTYTYLAGAKYRGSFRAGRPAGTGTLYYPNGDIYKGGWEENGPYGRGVMYYANGRTTGGIWLDGKLQRYLYANDEVMPEYDVPVLYDPDVRIWAVIVGVGDYTYNRKLNYTKDDAYAVYAQLRSPMGGAVPDTQITLLTDAEATRANILESAQRTLWQADDNDVVLFYFSGHGLQDQFLTYDFDGYHNRLQHADIRTIMARSQAKHKLVLADACYSGSLMRSKSPHGGADHRYFEAFEASEGGTAFLLSSTEAEESLEDNHLKGGVFTYFLLRGMTGKADFDHNGIVTISELFPYVQKNVVRYTSRRQTPVLIGQYADDMPLSTVH